MLTVSSVVALSVVGVVGVAAAVVVASVYMRNQRVWSNSAETMHRERGYSATRKETVNTNCTYMLVVCRRLHRCGWRDAVSLVRLREHIKGQQRPPNVFLRQRLSERSDVPLAT